MKLKSTRQFDRAYRKFVRRYPFLKSKIDDALHQMTVNLADPSLGLGTRQSALVIPTLVRIS